MKVAVLVENTSSRGECISALKTTKASVEDFVKKMPNRNPLQTPLEEVVFKAFDAQLRKAVGRFLLQSDAKYEAVAGQLRPCPPHGPSEVDQAHMGTSSMEVEPTAETRVDPISLNDDVEFVSSEIIYVPNAEADPAASRAPLLDPTPLAPSANVDQYLTFRKEVKT